MKRMRRRKLSQTKFLHFHDLEPSCSFSFFTSYLLSIAARLAILYYISYHLFHSQWLARGQDALVYRIDRCGQVRWSLSQVAGVRIPEVDPAGGGSHSY